MTTTHKILYSSKGNENATTKPDPIGFVIALVGTLVTYLRHKDGEAATADLNAEGTFCVSWDNDMLTTSKVYSIREVVLPDWLDPFEWLANDIGWKYTWGFGVDMDWPESWQRFMHSLSGSRKLAAVKLLRTKNFRSSFRKSIRDQIVSWCETEPDKRRYGSPLSDRQWQAIATDRDFYEARAIDNQLYYSR